MKEKTFNYIREYHMAERGDGVIVGLSGGADSVCLLRILCCLKEELGIDIRAVHVHHGLRGGEADRDAAFSEVLCKELGVPFRLAKIRASEEAERYGISVEEAGRQARYRIFEEEAKAWEVENPSAKAGSFGTEAGSFGAKAGKLHVKIATAHHGNDSAETVLHNLFRGTGLKGLSGITPVRGRIIRPILWAQREEILGWLEEQGYAYVEDSTNRESEYTRNLIRNELLPLVTSRINGQAVQNILRASQRIGEADRYLEKKADEWIKAHFDVGKNSFPASELLGEDRIIRGYVVRRILAGMGCPLKDITARHVDSILELTGKGTGKQVDLPYGITAVNEYGVIRILRESEASAIPEMEFRVFSYENHQEIPKNQYTKWFDYDNIKDTLSVRKRRTGDYITLASGGRKTVKAFMIDEKIPRKEREDILLLAEGDHVLWIIGYRISEYYKVTEHTKNVLQVQLDGGTDSGR